MIPVLSAPSILTFILIEELLKSEYQLSFIGVSSGVWLSHPSICPVGLCSFILLRDFSNYCTTLLEL